MASICNDVQGAFGVMSGHDRNTLSLLLWARRVALGGGIAVLVGCAAKGPGPLYMWESFPKQQYEALQRVGYSPDEQIRLLEAHAEKALGAHAALPPGFRAHLGMLQLGAGNVDRARELWMAEKTAFPESAAYMDHLLKKLDAPAKSAKTETPA
ncbi:MAG: DUF4810 domain-containing protein [Burkholderiales bacterium]|nr:DUF4810 domain-containing protein [Burkholderiales bacterium]